MYDKINVITQLPRLYINIIILYFGKPKQYFLRTYFKINMYMTRGDTQNCDDPCFLAGHWIVWTE